MYNVQVYSKTRFWTMSQAKMGWFCSDQTMVLRKMSCNGQCNYDSGSKIFSQTYTQDSLEHNILCNYNTDCIIAHMLT